MKSCISAIRPTTPMIFLAFVYYFVFRLSGVVAGSSCTSSNQSYDFFSQTCIQCSDSCSTCFGTSATQCSTCRTGYYKNIDDGQCVDSCADGYYQNETDMTCVQCEVTGCKVCDAGQTCLQCNQQMWYDYSNQRCILYQNVCSSNQFFSTLSSSCQSQCNSGQAENYVSRLCDDIQDCASMSSDSQDRVTQTVQHAVVLSNNQALLFTLPCRFYMTTPLLKILYSVDLITENLFTEETETLTQFLTYQNRAGCMSPSLLVLYDFVDQNEVLRINSDFTNIAVRYSYFNQNILVLEHTSTKQVSVLYTDQQITVNLFHNNESNLRFFLINSNLNLFIFYFPAQQSSYFFQPINDETYDQYLVGSQQLPEFEFCDTVYTYNHLNAFYCFTTDSLMIYKIANQTEATMYTNITDTINSILVGRFFKANLLSTLSQTVYPQQKVHFIEASELMIMLDRQESNTADKVVIYSTLVNLNAITYVDEIDLGLKVVGGRQFYVVSRPSTSEVYLCFPLASSFIYAMYYEWDIQSSIITALKNYKTVDISKYDIESILEIDFVNDRLTVTYMKSSTKIVNSIQISTSDNSVLFYTTESITNYIESSNTYNQIIPTSDTFGSQVSITWAPLEIGSKDAIHQLFLELPLPHFQSNELFTSSPLLSTNLIATQAQISVIHMIKYLKVGLYYIQYTDMSSVNKVGLFDSETMAVSCEYAIPNSSSITLKSNPTVIISSDITYLIVGNLNLLISLNNLAIISEFAPSPSISSNQVFFQGDTTQIILFIDTLYELQSFDLSTKTLSLVFSNQSTTSLVFQTVTTDSTTQLLECLEYIYLIENNSTLLAFSVTAMAIESSSTIDLSAFGGSLDGVIVSQSNGIYIFEYDRVNIYDSTLGLLEQVALNTAVPRLAKNYFSIESSNYIVFAVESAVYRFDTSAKSLSSVSISIQVTEPLSILGFLSGFLCYANNIISINQMQVVSILPGSVSYEHLSYISTETNSLLIGQLSSYDDTASQQLIKNFENQPVITFSPSSQQILVHSEWTYYGITCFYYSSVLSQLLISSILKSTPITETFNFAASYDIMKVDPSRRVFIYSSGGSLYKFNATDSSPTPTLINVVPTIRRIDLCPDSYLAVVNSINSAVYIFNYLNGTYVISSLIYTDTLGSVEYEVQCDTLLFYTKTPTLYIYSLLTGLPHSEQPQASISKQLPGTPALVDTGRAIFGFFGTYGQATLKSNNQYVTIKDFFVKRYVSQVFYDYNWGYLIHLNGFNRTVSIYSIWTGSLLQTYTTAGLFHMNPSVVSFSLSTVNVIDEYNVIYVFDYKQKSVLQSQLSYTGVSQLIIDESRQLIFFATSYYVHVHEYPSLNFAESLIDSVFPSNTIKVVKLISENNVLIVMKANQAVIVYDLQEIVNDTPSDLLDNQIPPFLLFNTSYAVVYNIRSQSVSLFKHANFKQLIDVKVAHSPLPRVGRLIKVSSNRFIYWNAESFLCVEIDYDNNVMTKMIEIALQIDVNDVFFNNNTNKIYLTDAFTQSIYSISLDNVGLASVVVELSDSTATPLIHGRIMPNNLVFYSGLVVYSYDFALAALTQSIFSSSPSLILKISSATIDDGAGVFSIHSHSNRGESTSDSTLLVINNESQSVYIIDSSSLSIKFTLPIDYKVINTYIDLDRNAIFLVGNFGYTVILSYELAILGTLQNPCLGSTSILSDDHFIYAFCASQLLIFNRLSLDLAYPRIIGTFTRLRSVFYTEITDMFIVSEISKLSIVSISSSTGAVTEISAKTIKGAFNLISQRVYTDSNGNKRVIVFGVTFFDVVYFDIPLLSSSVCALPYTQQVQYYYDYYLQNQSTTQLSSTTQTITQLNVEIANWDSFKILNFGNLDDSGVKLRIYSTAGHVDAYNSWWFPDIISSSVLVHILQVDSMNLYFGGIDSINSHSNIEKMVIQDVYVQAGSAVTIDLLGELYLNAVRMINFTWQGGKPVFLIRNCTSVVITTLIIENSTFDYFPVIQFENVATIQIYSVVVVNSSFKTLFDSRNCGQLSIYGVSLSDVSGVSATDSLIKSTRVNSVQTGNIVLDKQSNGILFEFIGCTYAQIDNLIVKDSNNVVLIQSNQYTLENSNQVFLSSTLNVNTLKITSSTNIRNSIVHDNVSFTGWTVTGMKMTPGLSINVVTATKLSIINCTFDTITKNARLLLERQLASVSEEPIILYDFDVSNQLFIEAVQVTSSSVCVLSFGNASETATITLTTITAADNTCASSLVKVTQAASLTVTGSTFTNNVSTLDGGALFIEKTPLAKFTSSTCSVNSSLTGNGGCMYIADVPSMTISHVDFVSNESILESGGAIYSLSSSNSQLITRITLVDSCTFTTNKATKGKGGAIALHSANLISSSTNIKTNKAAIGGGIHYSHIVPDCVVDGTITSANTIESNKAVLYGQNIGSIPRKISFTPESSSAIVYEDSVYKLSNFQSGTEIKLSGITLLDEEDNTIGYTKLQSFNEEVSQFLSSFYLSITAEELSSQTISTTITIGGGTIVQNTGSGYSFNVTLAYLPLYTSGLLVSSPVFEALTDTSGVVQVEEKALAIHFQVGFRDCKVGEIITNTTEYVTCETCPDGKYSISSTDATCKVCPAEAVSCSGSSIVLKSGYWRASNDSDTIVACENLPFACDDESAFSKLGCVMGYEGPVCESCSYNSELWGERYSNLDGNTCVSCSEQNVKFIVKWIVSMLIIFIQINFSVTKTVNSIQLSIVSYYLKLSGLIYLNKSVEDKKDGQAYKILIDHLQILSAASAFQIQLPNILTLANNILGNPASAQNNQMDCFFPFTKYEYIPVWVFAFIWSVSMPLLMILLLILFQMFKRNWQYSYLPPRYNSTIAASIYLHYLPSIVMLMTKCMNCRVVGNISYSQIDLGIECSDYENHQRYVYMLVIPILVIVCIILPFVLARLIKYQRTSKKSAFETTTLRFLYDPYRDAYYFWDQIKLLMKSITMIFSILLAESQNTQTRVICGVLFVYLVTLQKFQPYKKPVENQMDMTSMMVCIFTLVISNISYQSNNSFLVVLIALITFSINGYFIGHLLFKVFVKPIPPLEADRSALQKFLLRIQKKYPVLQLPMQKQVSFKTLRKIGLLKRGIRKLALKGNLMQNTSGTANNLPDLPSIMSSTESNMEIFRDNYVPQESQNMFFRPRTLQHDIQNTQEFQSNEQLDLLHYKQQSRLSNLKQKTLSFTSSSHQSIEMQKQ